MVVELLAMSFIILIEVAVKYPGFKKPENQEARLVSATRAYCNSTEVHLQIGSLCLLLPQVESEKQGDRSGFYSAAFFSGFAFSMSRKLKLPEEYGVTYMCLEFTMNALIAIPGKGDSLLDWKLMYVTTSFCFVLVVLKNIFGFFDHQKIRHDRQNGNSGSGGEDGDGDVDSDGRNGGRGNSDILTPQVSGSSSVAGNHSRGGSIRRRLGDASSTHESELNSIACEEEIVPSVDSDEEPSPHGDLKGKHQRWDTESESEDGDDEDDNENGWELVRVQSSSNKSSSKYINVDWRFLLSIFNKGMTLNLFGDVLSNNIYSQAQSSTSQITPTQSSPSQNTSAQSSTSQITPVSSDIDQINEIENLKRFENQQNIRMFYEPMTRSKILRDEYNKTKLKIIDAGKESKFKQLKSLVDQGSNEEALDLLNELNNGLKMIDLIIYRIMGLAYIVGEVSHPQGKESKFKQLESLVDRGSNEEALKYLTGEINHVLRSIELFIDGQMGKVPVLGEVSPLQDKESKFKQLKSLVDQRSNEEALDLVSWINSNLKYIDRIIDRHKSKTHIVGDANPPQGKESKFKQLETEEALELTIEIISVSESDLIKGKMGKGPIDWDPSDFDFDFDTPEIELDLHLGEKSASL
ncbi:hypothetical protein ACFE04_000456 [Oxalis oulophora]